ACAQPSEQDNEQEDEANQNANAYDENRLWNLAARFVELLGIFATVELVIEVTAPTTAQARKPGGKADHQPFFKIERLKQNLFHQLGPLTKRLQHFDLWFSS